MEIINVEKQTFEALIAGFEALAGNIEMLCRANADKSSQKWMDNEEVCRILNISKRTLQTYRDSGTLPFSQIGHKMYYRPQDVEQVINKLKWKEYE